MVVATNSGPGGSGPNILLLSPETGFSGLGRAVFVGDEEIFMTGLFSGERSGQLDPVVRPFNDNEELFLNTFAFLAGAPGLSANANFSACAAPAIQELIADVVQLNLKKGISNSLDAKLDAAVQALDDINQNNNVAAINALQAFINSVAAQRGLNISDADATALIATARAIIALLGGP